MVVLRSTGGGAPAVREAQVPPALSRVLPVARAQIWGEGWLAEPRGVSVSADGTVAVADPLLSRVVLMDPGGAVAALDIADELQQPESVAWTPEGLLAIADTWGQRAVLFRRATSGLAPLPVPPDGWWGPRGVAVADDGTLAVSDTGNKRVVVYTPGAGQTVILGGPGSEAGQLVEPGGLAWLGDGGLVVCDTGNRRLQVFDPDGGVRRVVQLPASWTDFYSRPQVAIVEHDLWVATDPPARSLVVVDGDEVTTVDLGAEGMSPAGVAWHDGALYVTDLERGLWVFFWK